MKIFSFTGTEPFSKTTRVKPAVIFRLCSNRSVPALLNLAFCIACFLGGGRSILLSYVDVFDPDLIGAQNEPCCPMLICDQMNISIIHDSISSVQSFFLFIAQLLLHEPVILLSFPKRSREA